VFKRIVPGILFVLLLASIFAAAFSIQQAKANGVDWWPMFHHDLTHTGYSTSPAPTSDTLWSYTTGNYLESSSPAVAGGVVYVGSNDNNVYALNATTGALIWNYTTGGGVGYSSPAVADGVVYVGSYDDSVYALNAATGALIWSYTTGGWVYSSPAVSGGVVYVGSNDHKVYALNAATGALIWSYTTGSHVDSSPAVAGGVVYVGSHDGKVYAFGSGPAIPEFPSYLVLPLFVATTLLAAVLFKRKRNINA
jgi:outer membrane protein assembly factor BamB